jgi:hypothetical protein
MYKNGGWTSGFSVTYEVPDDFTGWTTETHLFGYDYLTDNQETITLENDLQAIQICADINQVTPGNDDFEGFNFIEYDGKETRLSPGCPYADWITIDLTG